MPAYSPAERLERLRALLSSRAHTLAELVETLEVSESTVRRLLAAVERVGEPLVEVPGDDGRKLWSLKASARPAREHTVRMTTAQLLALLLARNAARAILRGTGFDDDLDALCTRLTDTLTGSDAALAKDLDRKLHDRGEMTWVLDEHADVLDEIFTALLHGERLLLRRMASDGEERTHLFDPYTLVTHDKGLFLVGFSHDRGQRISLGIDIVREATRQRGDTFPYPGAADYDPTAMFAGTIGMFTGPITHVVLRVAKPRVRHVMRRRVHASQTVVREHEDGSIDIALDVASNPELENHILSYGEHAEVLEPLVLRRRIAERLKQTSARYAAS